MYFPISDGTSDIATYLSNNLISYQTELAILKKYTIMNSTVHPASLAPCVTTWKFHQISSKYRFKLYFSRIFTTPAKQNDLLLNDWEAYSAPQQDMRLSYSPWGMKRGAHQFHNLQNEIACMRYRYQGKTRQCKLWKLQDNILNNINKNEIENN